MSLLRCLVTACTRASSRLPSSCHITRKAAISVLDSTRSRESSGHSSVRHLQTTHTLSGQLKNPFCVTVHDQEDFNVHAVESEAPVIVDFYADWCGPCKIIGPRLESAVSKFNGAVRLVKVNVDNQPELAMRYEVQSIPTVFAMKMGQKLDKFVGVIDDDEIETFVNKLADAHIEQTTTK